MNTISQRRFHHLLGYSFYLVYFKSCNSEWFVLFILYWTFWFTLFFFILFWVIKKCEESWLVPYLCIFQYVSSLVWNLKYLLLSSRFLRENDFWADFLLKLFFISLFCKQRIFHCSNGIFFAFLFNWNED